MPTKKSVDPALVTYEEMHPITVSSELTDPHYVTREAANWLRNGRERDFTGAVSCWGTGTFYIQVHPDTVERVLRIVDALAKAFDTRGFELRYPWDGRQQAGLAVRVDGELIELALDEGILAVENKSAQRGRRSRTQPPTYTHVSTGRLSLRTSRYAQPDQREWKDEPSRSLESRLNEVMLDLRALAASRLEARRRQEEEDRPIEELLRARAELRRQVEKERKAVDGLFAEVENWQKAQALRAYIATVDEIPAPKGKRRQRAAWVKWAHDQADRLDPLCHSPSSVLDTPRKAYRELDQFEVLDEDGNIERIWG